MNVKRMTELDGLRGLAALAVVIYHYFYRYDEVYGHQFESSELFRFGYYGVHLFFIVSGFVIFWSISRSEQPLDFVWSRFSRLYPPFWIAVTITFVAVAIFSLPNREVATSTFLLNLFMFHEYFGVAHVDGVYWTLTLELAFYFWILVVFCMRQIKNIEKILIVWITAATILTFYKFDFPIGPKLQKFLLLDFIELFSAGICFYKYKTKTHSKLTSIVLALSILTLFFSYSLKGAVALCGFYFVFWLIINNKAPVLGNTLLVYLGTISYSLYLVHQNIGYMIINKSYLYGFDPLLGMLFAFALSVGLSHLILVYIERPSLISLRQFYKTNNKVRLLRNKLGFDNNN